MNKNLKFYVIIWALMLVVFNVLVFVIPSVVEGICEFDMAFWITYIIVTLAFIGQLFCAIATFKTNNLEKVFLRLPLVKISYFALIVSVIIACVFILIPFLPCWIAGILCLAILVFSVIAVLKAYAAGDIVADIGAKLKVQTAFIKFLTIDIDSLILRSKSETAKMNLKKVYDAVRYSDPMSSSALFDIELHIKEQYEKLVEAVEQDNNELILEICNKMNILIKDRNNKCKALK